MRGSQDKDRDSLELTQNNLTGGHPEQQERDCDRKLGRRCENGRRELL